MIPFASLVYTVTVTYKSMQAPKVDDNRLFPSIGNTEGCFTSFFDDS